MKVLNFVVALLFAVGLCLAPIVHTESASAASSSTKKMEKSTKKSSKKSKKNNAEKRGKKQAKKQDKKLPAGKSISINKANKKELMTLPGIGPKMADEIIKYRKANKFKSLEDLKKVKGIGDKTFANIKKYLKP